MADDTSFSSRAVREFHSALTDGSIFGVPRYTTALLPPVTGNQGGLAWDTTTNSLKGCDGSTWSSTAGTPFSGGTVTSPIFAPQTAGTTAGTISYSFTGDTDTGIQNYCGRYPSTCYGWYCPSYS